LDFFSSNVGEDGGLNGGSISNSFIGVDGSVRFFSVEEVLNQLDDFGDSGRSSD